MRNFWALPAVLRIALASQHAFSIFDDLLAFPQYSVVWADSFVTEDDATALLSSQQPAPETLELSKRQSASPSTPPADDALEQTYEAIVLHGQRYLCSIPVLPEEEPQNSTATAEETKAEEEKELMRASDRGFELLEGMRGNCIYYLSGWWSYSFCYKDEVKQFHQLPPSRGVPLYPPVEDPSTHSFVLGKFPREAKGDKDDERKTLGSEQGTKEAFDDEGNVRDDEKGLAVPRLETKGSSRYMVQRLSDGTECDLTGRPRKIDVQFHCNPQSADRIAMIKETSTCSYLMIVDTPRLCNDVAFMPPQETAAHPITCSPVIPDSEVDAWTTAQLTRNLRSIETLIDEATNPLRDIAEGVAPPAPVIGGIKVGAQILVGSEGKIIEKSVVVGGGKETFVGTVASSDGTQMSKEEMKKLNIVDPKDVERLKVNLKKLAGKKGWKLDLVDTPRGREYRGIIEGDEEEEGEGEGEGEKGAKEGKAKSGGMDKERRKGGKEGAKEKQNPTQKQKQKQKQKEKAKVVEVEDEDDEEVYEGSEEVYKDEL